MILVARDPLTFRRQTIKISQAWADPIDTEVQARYIASLAVTITQRWHRLYQVPAPMARLEWHVAQAEWPDVDHLFEGVTDEAEFRRHYLNEWKP